MFSKSSTMSHDDGFKVLFHEVGRCSNLFITVVTAIRNDDQLVVCIVGPMNHCYALALKLGDWTVDAQNVSVQHLSIGSRNSWNKPIVDWVDKPMVRMLEPKGLSILTVTILFKKSLEPKNGLVIWTGE